MLRPERVVSEPARSMYPVTVTFWSGAAVTVIFPLAVPDLDSVYEL